MQYYWRLLKISPTNDVRAIKKAYASQLKITRPDDDMNAYQALREAYDWAIENAQNDFNPHIEEDSSANIESEQITETAAISDISHTVVTEMIDTEDSVLDDLSMEYNPYQTNSFNITVEDFFNTNQDTEVAVSNAADQLNLIDHSIDEDLEQLILSPDEIIQLMDTIRKEKGSVKLLEYWPQIHHHLDELPLTETNHASIAMADYVLKNDQIPEKFLAYLTNYFDWGKDFHQNQILGTERAEELNSLLDKYLLISFPLSAGKEPLALELYSLLDGPKTFLDRIVAIVIAFFTSPSLSRELDADLIWDLWTDNSEKWHKKLYPLLNTLIVARIIQIPLFICTVYWFLQIQIYQYSVTINEKIASTILCLILCLFLFFIYLAYRGIFNKLCVKGFYSYKTQIILDFVIPVFIIVLFLLMRNGHFSIIKLLKLEQIFQFILLIAWLFVFSLMRKTFLLGGLYKVCGFLLVGLLFYFDLLHQNLTIGSFTAALQLVLIMWWNACFFIWINWQQKLLDFCLKYYTNSTVLKENCIAFIFFAVVLSPLIVCVCLLFLPFICLVFFERYRLGYFVLALLSSYGLVLLSIVLYEYGYLTVYLHSITLVFACILPLFILIQEMIYKRAISFLTQYLANKKSF